MRLPDCFAPLAKTKLDRVVFRVSLSCRKLPRPCDFRLALSHLKGSNARAAAIKKS
ncbi:hypothetical protein AMST5_01635 [freshwater sediment metagenome]|uniref:Uncharacterized protein n=1 Tax=freshwater sediment metagenome TaxID=556182 RepID=A0AA48LYQ1_9ZZZZ